MFENCYFTSCSVKNPLLGLGVMGQKPGEDGKKSGITGKLIGVEGWCWCLGGGFGGWRTLW